MEGLTVFVCGKRLVMFSLTTIHRVSEDKRICAVRTDPPDASAARPFHFRRTLRNAWGIKYTVNELTLMYVILCSLSR
jgi:hypothetical protein